MTKTICICGAGTMGSGIAQVAAMSGFRTLLYDVNKDILQKGRVGIEKSLQTLSEKKKIDPEKLQSTLDCLSFVHDAGYCQADVIIEAIVEKAEAKLELFGHLAALNSEYTILASNTSSLSLTTLAEKISGPERVVGMHFFNPAPLMKLVEVVYTKYTDKKNSDSIFELARQMGKTPVLCKDAPGFIVNHVARPYYLEALRLVEQGLADFETVDILMEASGFKMGPFRLMDLIGNDVNYAVSCSVYEALGKPERLKPSHIQEQKVQQGELGRKTGKGYYQYSPPNPLAP
ncbi:3-hydroxyacyl-CoA dehydrogenase NAD-binding domain-containing protein [Flavitalea flava]